MDKKVPPFFNPGLQLWIFDKDDGKQENCHQLKEDRQECVDFVHGVREEVGDGFDEIPNACHF